jgi:hypothetical protein
MQSVQVNTVRGWSVQVRIEQAENRLDLAMVADLKYGALQEVDEQIRRCVCVCVWCCRRVKTPYQHVPRAMFPECKASGGSTCSLNVKTAVYIAHVSMAEVCWCILLTGWSGSGLRTPC